MSIIYKEKNYIYITVEGKEKPYVFNINTGEIIGFSGKVLTQFPSNLRRTIYYSDSNIGAVSMIKRLLEQGISLAEFPRYAKYINLADRLDSIGYNLTGRNFNTYTILDFIDLHFVNFAKAYSENKELNLQNFYQNESIKYFCKENNFTIDEHFTEEQAWRLFRMSEHFEPDQLKLVKYYISRGVADFLNYVCFRQRMIEYFRYCKLLNVIPKKGDFIYNFTVVEREYTLRKSEIENGLISANQETHQEALSFEDEIYKVIIPKTSEEFFAEAKAQHNCVASLYLSKVIDGSTNIVFIRKKENESLSYITCEVHDGVIVQYLEKYNNKPEDYTAKNFAVKYQEHIRKFW